MITYTNSLDMTPGGVPLVVHVGQYDNDFSLVFNLYASSGTFTIQSGTTAEIRGTKADGNGYSANATIDTSNSRVTVAGNQQMTAVAGQQPFELVLLKSGNVLSTANFILDVERAAMDADTIQSDTVLKELNAIIAGAATATAAAESASASAEAAAASAATLEIDDTLSITGRAADAKKTGDEISGINGTLYEKGLSEEAKIALLNCLTHLAWIDGHGRDYYDALKNAIYPYTGLVAITAVFTQGGAVITPNTPLNDLKAYLVVTGYYGDSSTRTITDYALSGTLEVGTSTITVTKYGKTATFNVTVTSSDWDYEWTVSQGALPEGMTADSYSYRSDLSAMLIYRPNMSFGELGDMEVELECRAYIWDTSSNNQAYGSSPQIVISTGSQKGMKLVAEYGDATTNPSHYYAVVADGSNALLDTIRCNEFHTIHMKAEDGVYSLNIDGTDYTVSHSGTSQYFNTSGIVSTSFNDGRTARLLLRSLKYKSL